ncbi:MAG: DNA/RNA nuclease SfsA [Lachnospiraceae bacterium]
MRYEITKRATFLSRPNRFIAYVEADGKEEKVHVKNTGRCKELLTPGATVILADGLNEKRATKYDLIAVYKEYDRPEKQHRLINMDSQAPNKVVGEWLAKTCEFGEIMTIKPEYTYGNSRIDFYFETRQDGRLIRNLMEVKGVTLEQDGVCRFPDAPTLRGVKHMLELQKAVEEGFRTYLMFVIQMDEAKAVAPNDATDKDFGDTFRQVTGAGVIPLAYTCRVTENELLLDKPIPVWNN